MENNLNKILAKEYNTIKEVMRIIDISGFGISLIVDDDDKLLGLVSEGDIRRAIINGGDIKSKISDIMNKNPITVNGNTSNEEIINLMINKNVAGKIPILDENNKVLDLAILPSTVYGSSINNYPQKSTDKLAFLNKQKGYNIIKNTKRILIIGGAGYLGSILSKRLIEINYKVRVFDKLLFGISPISDLIGMDNFELVKGDICNIPEVYNALKDVDSVILLAGIVGDPASSLNPKKTIEVNYIATKTIAEMCKYNQINRFIFASSCSVYGANKSIITEESELNPLSLYAQSKISSEKGILEIADDNFSPTIMRMATLYGYSPRLRLDLVINTLTAKAIKEKKITIFGGNQWRPFIHVKDAAEAYIKVLEAPINKIKNQTFNVGGDNLNYKIIEIAKLIKGIIPDVIVNIEENSKDERDYKVSFDKIKNILNFEPKKEIQDGIIEIKKITENGIINNISGIMYNNYIYQKYYNE